MDANSSKPISIAAEREKRLLRKLSFHDRRLIEWSIASYPGLTAAEAIEMCADFGGLDLSSPEARELLAKFGGR
jgi:hypothetical protein